MSAAKMTDITRQQLESVMAALEITSRADLAKLCELKGVGAVNSWFRNGRIPQQRLDLMALKFAIKFRVKKDLNLEEQKAKDFIEEKYFTPLATMISIASLSRATGRTIKLVLKEDAANHAVKAQGSALPLKPLDSAFTSSDENENLFEDYKPEAMLEKLTLNQLVEEIEKRGWTVQLVLKNKPS